MISPCCLCLCISLEFLKARIVEREETAFVGLIVLYAVRAYQRKVRD
jgi:hypothetical protein